MINSLLKRLQGVYSVVGEKILEVVSVMDWNLAAFDQETVSSIDVVSKTSALGAQEFKGELSDDLNLGRVFIPRNELSDSSEVPGFSKMALSNLVSPKRARTINNGSMAASCLVDGCNADLSNCKDYHRRHKVCEPHSKTPQVTINGHKQRFCQQCSRFHSLEEFDGRKRSCRKRLDGHNRRRRKPQPGPLSRIAGTMSPSAYQEAGLLSCCNSTVYPTRTVGSPFWAGVVKADEESNLCTRKSQWQLQNQANSDLGGRNFHSGTNLALNNQATIEAFNYKPFLKMVSSSDSGTSGGSLKISCCGLPTGVLKSDCAVYLLSSPTQTSTIGLSNVMQHNSIPTPPHPLDPGGLHYSNVEGMDCILASDAAAAGSSVHCQEMFHTGPDVVPSANETPQTLPFYWEQ